MPIESSHQPPITLLVVSNDRSILEVVHACFPPPHYHCVRAGDGQGALAELRQSPCQLVLAEFRLPDTNGLELLKRIREMETPPGLVLVCSYRDWELAIEAMRMGAADCLTKPLRREHVVAAVARALEHRKSEVERSTFLVLLEATLQERTDHLRQALQEVEHSQRATLETLVMALDSRERMTHLHSLRVQAYTVLLADRCGYGGAGMPELAYGALLHDIGKIVIPDSILLKPGPLTPEETRIMQQHPTRGYQILSHIPHLQQTALLALSHHERMDGTGYPLGLRSEEIPVESRIFAVADALDVILSGRPYCPARTLGEARSELIRCAGTQFDQDVVEVFQQIADDELVHIQEAVASRVPVTDSPLPALQGVPF
ncbi:MAG TPA: HD domain-containing phosphohydrolase [Terriglobia bacterium]